MSLANSVFAALQSPRDLLERSKVNPSASDVVLEATREMCFHCFDVLIAYLMGHDVNGYRAVATKTPEFMKNIADNLTQSPLFVTWEKRRHVNSPTYDLRGCIGSLSPKTLSSAVGEYAITSALRDRRFHPISIQEVPFLRVGVSLLVKYESAKNCFDWIVGLHGITISWRDPVTFHDYSATYLPEVAEEQGWGQEEAVKSLIKKAGYLGNVSNELLQSIQCQRYQSSKARVTYEDYVQYAGGDPVASAVLVQSGRNHFSAKHDNCRIM